MDTVTALVYGAAFSAVVGALLGSRRGRPRLGSLLGILLGPVGWLAVLLASDRRPKCPRCKGAVESSALKCPHCGAELVRRATVSGRAPCRFCGALIDRAAVRCPQCGEAAADATGLP